MSRPARSWSEITTATASSKRSRKRTSVIHAAKRSPPVSVSNHVGLGHDPVTVVGRILASVAVNILSPSGTQLVRVLSGGWAPSDPPRVAVVLGGRHGGR